MSSFQPKVVMPDGSAEEDISVSTWPQTRPKNILLTTVVLSMIILNLLSLVHTAFSE